MSNPIIERELLGLLRSRRAFALQWAVAVVFALLVIVRWPSEAQVELSGAESQQVFRVFGYGLLAVLLLLAPAFPSASIVRERLGGTLALLLNSPMTPLSIYAGKMAGVVGFALLLLAMSVPAAAACYAMGGVSLGGQILALYVILTLVAVEYSALGLFISSFARSTDSALRVTYGCSLLASAAPLGPHQFLQGSPGGAAALAAWLRCISPIPAVMELMGQGDVGSHGLLSPAGCPARFVLLASIAIFALAAMTIARLNGSLLDRARGQGVMTDDRSAAVRWGRRLFFIVDPQRRKRGIGPLANAVLVKEFRSRRFGRSHWILRLVAACAVLSLALAYAATAGTLDWGVDTIGGVMVLLQIALIILAAPSLTAGLITAELESGGWELLMMTPLRPASILAGKLLSVAWTLALILLATLPGYLVILAILPEQWPQVARVLICLGWMSIFALSLGGAVSSCCRRTAAATTITYSLLGALVLGTLLVWLGRDAPFGRGVVEAVLALNPLAAALSVLEAPGFKDYDLVPANWWWMAFASLFLLLVLILRTWRLALPR